MAFHDYFGVETANRDLDGNPSLSGPARLHWKGWYHRGGKRVLDVFLVVIALPIILPVILLLAAIVACGGGKPFYSQPRAGLNGRHYRLWKLRSMVPDADARLEAYLAADPAARAEWNSAQKLKNDPRITRFGRLLRQTSLDELPQLWNVLKGDMSLVGPRPIMVNQEDLYPGRAYYTLRPGITGLWQVSERNESTFAERVRFDDEYARDLSFAMDIRVLLATIAVVLRGTGY